MPPGGSRRGRGGGARGRGGRGNSNNNSVAQRILRTAENAAKQSSLSSTTTSAAQGPSDAERQFPKLSDEQVAQFLAGDDAFDAAFAQSTRIDNKNVDQNVDANDDKVVASKEVEAIEDLVEDGTMPEPPPMDDSSLVGRLLDPDAGGEGQNRDGLGGLIAPPKASGNARQRIRAKIRAMREQRTTLNEETTMRDNKGRKVPGRVLSPEAIQAGIRPPKNSQIDQTLTAQKRKELLEAMRANMNQKREAQLANIGAPTTSSSAAKSSTIDDDSADIGL